MRASKPVYLIALSILAGCGGSSTAGTQSVLGAGYTFEAPTAWAVTRAATRTSAASGAVDLVQVQEFRLVKPYRPELFAAASQELDRVARQLAGQLSGRERTAITVASRVVTDEEIQDKLRDAMENLRSAADRLQGRREHAARNRALLVTGIALGILFNPVTGPETRRFLKDMMFGGGGSGYDSFGGDQNSDGGS